MDKSSKNNPKQDIENMVGSPSVGLASARASALTHNADSVPTPIPKDQFDYETHEELTLDQLRQEILSEIGYY